MKDISIAVDLDSTLNNLDEAWILRDYNKKWDDNLTAEDMVSWLTHTYVKPECGEKVYDILKEPEYFRKLGLKDQWTQEGFSWLYENFDVYVVSSFHPETVADKVAWLKDHFPQFDEKRFIACNPKHIIDTDWLIDDGSHNVESFKNESILIDAAYNRHLKEEDHNFLRLKNWKEIKLFFQAEAAAQFAEAEGRDL